MTTPGQFKEYIWLVNTIYKARKISLKDINEQWLQTEMSEGVEINRTTFYRHRRATQRQPPICAFLNLLAESLGTFGFFS